MEKINDGGTEFHSIYPMTVDRNSEGMWTHPGFDCEEEYVPREWFSDRGLEVCLVEFEFDANEDLIDRWYEDNVCDCSGWNPSRPDGDGWFILSIHDTEDGPICVWVRNIEDVAEVKS